MAKTHIEIFSGESAFEVERQANDWAKEHDAEIVSTSLAVQGESYFTFHLAVVYKL